MDNSIKEFAEAINNLLGRDVVELDLENFDIEVKNAYTIVCNDEDDMFNTLSAMLDGIRLCISVRG
jgi:hypothetical protein